MKEITIKVYTFEELSKDVQERLISEYRQSNDYGEDLEDYLRERLKELTGLSFNLEYSLNNVQSDGLRFIGSFYGEKINKLPFAHLVKDANSMIISINPSRYGRSAYRVDIDIDTKDEEYTDEEWEDLQDAVDLWYSRIRDTLEEDGYGYIEDMESDEHIRECLIDLGEYYTKDGRVV